MGDKPATKRREVPLVWDRMPHATLPIRTEEEAIVQQTKVKSYIPVKTRKMSDSLFLQFLELWAEDPVTAEPEDDPME